jgi:hypothetical protein
VPQDETGTDISLKVAAQLINSWGIFWLFLFPTPAHASAWELAYEADNLRIYTRPYVGSQLDEIRGVVRIKASLNAAMALLKDAEFNRYWVYRSGGARILQQSGFLQAYVYGIVDAPWPMDDRDTVVRFDYQQDAGTKEITIEISNHPDFIPVRDGYIRVAEFGGFWKLKPLEEGWLEVTYDVYGDPGGWIPAWLANRAAMISVKNTLRNMGSAVQRYEGLRSPLVEEIDQPGG